MMKEFLVICIFCIAGSHVMAQEHVMWKGRVLEKDSRNPIAGVHLRSSNQQGVSDQDGNFEIPIIRGEQVIVSHVGYQTLVFIIPTDASPKELFLIPSEQELGEVTVTSMPSETELKQLLLNTNYIPSQMEVNLGYNISYMSTIYRLRNNHIENGIDHMLKKISSGNGEATFFSTNPSMGILGVIKSFRKPGAIQFEKPREFHYPPAFRTKGDTTIRFNKYFD